MLQTVSQIAQLATNVQHHWSITAKHNTCAFVTQRCTFRRNEASSGITSRTFKSFTKNNFICVQHVTTQVQLQLRIICTTQLYLCFFCSFLWSNAWRCSVEHKHAALDNKYQTVVFNDWWPCIDDFLWAITNQCICCYVYLSYYIQRSLLHVSATCYGHLQGAVLWRNITQNVTTVYIYKMFSLR